MESLLKTKKRFSPVTTMVLVSITALAAIALAAQLSLSGPWLGARFQPAPGGVGVAVVEVSPHSPAEGVLHVGQRLTAVGGGGGGFLPLDGYDPGLEPHTLATFEAYNAYLDRQGRLADLIEVGETLVFRDTSGATISLTPAPGRPFGTLPANFWWFHAFGFLALLMGMSVWTFRREQMAARLLGLSGVGFFAATWCNSIYLARELAFPELWFQVLSRVNHLALTLMLGALLALFVFYPRPLAERRISLFILAALVVHQVNENLQWLNWPLHSFYLPLVLMYVVGIALAVRQWQLARFEALDRAALKWVFLSILLTMGTSMSIYFLPPLFDMRSVLSQTAMVGSAVLMYLGLVLGVLRFRLFELERWWFQAWLWFLGGFLVVIADLALAWAMNLGSVQALGLGLILAGWLYFPVRQWIWLRIGAPGRVDFERQLPVLVHSLLGAESPKEAERRWQAILEEVFAPLSIEPDNQSCEQPTLTDQGAVLCVPGIAGKRYRLRYAQRGRRLYAERDVEQSRCLLLVARRVCDIRHAQEEGARLERRRIMRDLHDDVGARVLTLVHQSTSERQADTARAALRSLRESMSALDDENERFLNDVLFDARAELEDRLAGSGLRLSWDQRAIPSDVPLRPREAINLRRIMDEAFSNALQHAHAERIAVRAAWAEGRLRMSVENDGVDMALATAGESGHSGEPTRGRGLKNMETRAIEIGATLSARPRGDGRFAVEIDWPLPARA